MPTPGVWADAAACKGSTQLFFSAPDDPRYPKREAGRRSRIARAKRVCMTCTVRAQCLDWALVTWPPMHHCVLGGMTDQERDAERRRRGL